MKKIFLSLPMKGRTSESIIRTIEGMKRIIKAYYPDEEIEFVDNFAGNEEEMPEQTLKMTKNPSLLYLGKAIAKMANCTHIAIISSDLMYAGYARYNGCEIEREVADRYHIKKIIIPDESGSILLPDLKAKIDIWKKGVESGECNGTGRYRCRD